jgi:hypothetical protein
VLLCLDNKILVSIQGFSQLVELLTV